MPETTEFTIQWERIAFVLALLAVLAVVFEVALSSIFNWRFFAKHCEGKGVKTPVTWIAAIVLLWTYDIDIFKEVINAFKPEEAMEPSVAGRIITGLLVAGGSGGVFSIFETLGIRNPLKIQEKAAIARKKAQDAKEAKAKEAEETKARIAEAEEKTGSG